MSGNSGNGAETRWKKGQSGNPNGRPPGSPRKNIMSEVLKQVVGETFMTTEGENPRDITRLEMLMKVLVSAAERGDKTCLTLLLKELRHIDDRDAVVNSPAEEALQKMKDASKSLIRKMNEFRAEEEPGWEAPPEMQPVYAPEPDDDTQEDSANGIDSRDPFTEPLAEEDSEHPQDASHAPIREAQDFDPPNRDLPHTRAENWDPRKHDGRVPRAEEPRETPQEASESLVRAMREFREEIEAEERANAQPNGVPATDRKRE